MNRSATSYNRIAGQSLERLAALSDGVFAVAMTLLALDLRAPAVESIHSEADLWTALVALGPRVLLYIVSFLTLGIFWVGQQTQLNHLAKSSRGLSWIHLGFLLAVCLIPFSTTLVAQFAQYKSALLVYWLNILALGVMLYFSWICAEGSGLVRPDVPPHFAAAIRKRIVVAQTWYAVAGGASLINTGLSLKLFAVVQLSFVLAPRWPGRKDRDSE